MKHPKIIERDDKIYFSILLESLNSAIEYNVIKSFKKILLSLRSCAKVKGYPIHTKRKKNDHKGRENST